jgi:RNA polymerase sigma factor (sigma-70 family)
MATSHISEVIQHLRRTALLRDGAGLTDGQLLEDYISRRDEAALAALVHRHGPMVWGVCHRVLRDYHDAEDAFQATFLVFVRKAASVASRELLANWIYGVAHQTALKARATAARRKERERQVTEMPEPAAAEQDFWRDLQPLLDEELSRLPDKYRSVIVLCDLEEKTRKQAARQLGCPEGTVGGWLARARVMLAKRLAQRGVALSGGALAAVLSQNVASAGVPTTVVSSTIKAATLFAAGQVAATGAIPVKVAALTEGVLKAMMLNKMRLAIVLLLVAATSGAVGLIYQTPATGASEVQTGSRAHEKAGPMPLPVDGIREPRRDFKLDGKVPEAQVPRFEDLFDRSRPLPEDGIWELRRDFKLDGKVEEAQDNTKLQLKRKGKQFSGHFVDKKANGKDNDSTFSGEVVAHWNGKSLLILRQEDRERDGYVVIHTGQLVGKNHFRGVWYDIVGQSGDFELKHSK